MKVTSILCVAIIVVAGISLFGCSKTDGELLELANLPQTCAENADCSDNGSGSCNDQGQCDCTSNADCDAFGYCNDEGICISNKHYRACAENDDCTPFGYCNEEGHCMAQCRVDDDCWLFNDGVDGDGEGGKICANCMCQLPESLPEDAIMGCPAIIATDWSCNYMTDDVCSSHHWMSGCGDRECAGYGWQYTCGEDNLCVDTGLDLGTVDDSKNAAAYTGVWGTVMTTAVRTKGLPLVPYQDTVSIHYMLTRVSQEDEGVTLKHKLCTLVIKNFKDDKVFDTDVAYMVIPEPYYKNVATIVQHTDSMPKLEAGATFESDRFWEVRGAWIDDPTKEGVLPGMKEYNNCEGDQACIDALFFDQDKDGLVAMTTRMTGALNGEVYSAQIWSSVIEAEVVDEDRIWAINNHTNEQYQVSASNPQLVYEIETVPYPEEERSYFRMLRMTEDATCEDVLAEKEKDGSWLNFSIGMDPEWTPPVTSEK